MTIDLQQPVEISSVSISTCVAKGDWVFDARTVAVEVSDDGKNFTKVASEEYPEMKKMIKTVSMIIVDLYSGETQYVRVLHHRRNQCRHGMVEKVKTVSCL